MTGIGARTGDRYFELMAEAGWRPRNLRFFLHYLFRDLDFSDKTMLDVGAGRGAFSFYAGCAGAAKVVSLEPEVEGSRAGAREAFLRTRSALGLDQVRLVSQRLQDYEPGGAFDIILLHASINHLDEGACIRLQLDGAARRVYRELFQRLAAMAVPHARLIVVDASRRNLFAEIGLKNPFVPSIEWHKHQPPSVWASLLTESGFGGAAIRWNSFNTLRTFGRLTLGNRLAAYCLTSTFCLTMERRGEPQPVRMPLQP